jgi:eukaryotic-like serine/threonine-protein kinase
VTEEADLIAGRYRLLEEVGSGGMGVVWRAKDELLGRTVALKALAVRSVISGSGNAAVDDESSRRAMREARIAARLHHPNVIGVYDIVEHERRPFLIMEFLASRSLSEMTAAGVTLPPAEAARIGALLAAGLTAAHSAGIVHRDVKPGNVLLAEDGTVKLTDFGISRAVGDTTVTASGILLGTLSYIAPEVGRGLTADARSDVYSLGATLYAAVEGQPPFGTDDNAIALLYRIVHEEITPPRNAGPLAPVLMWMLERDPISRPTMSQVRRALEAIEAGEAEGGEGNDSAAGFVADATPASEPDKDAAEPAAALSPSASSAPSEPDEQKQAARIPFERRQRVLIAGLIAVLLAVIGAIVLAETVGSHAASGNPAASSSHLASTAPLAPVPSPSASPSVKPSTRTTPSQAQTQNTTTASSPSAPASTASQSVASQLTSTIVNYYKLVPGDLDQAWGWMTADYQTNHAGGRNGYNSFWSQVQRVTLSGVTADPPSTVVATITYDYKNGSVVVERTSFGLVFQDGRWKIASSSVLSHSGG